MRPAACVWRALTLALGAGALTTGCLFANERICTEDEYPVLVLDGDRLGGGACVRRGEPPQPPQVRYPSDLEPTYLRDQSAATAEFQRRLDEGASVPGPTASPS